MKRLLPIVVIVLSLSSYNLYAQESSIVVEEGKGIQHIVRLGEKIDTVFKVWGAVERKQEDDYPPIYNYRDKGVIFFVDSEDRIQRIGMYIYKNPGFQGKTQKGLILNKRTTVKDIYKIYGKPATAFHTREAYPARKQGLKAKGEPFVIHRGGDSDRDIYYPKMKMMFYIQAKTGVVESCHMALDPKEL